MISTRIGSQFHGKTHLAVAVESGIAMQRSYPTERTELFRRHLGGAKNISRAAILALLCLTACSDVAYNPFASATVPGVEAPPAEGRPYPNLASVPRPVREPRDAAAQREREL